MSDTLTGAPRDSEARRGRPRAPRGAQSTGHDALVVLVEPTKQRRVCVPSRQLLAARSPRISRGVQAAISTFARVADIPPYISPALFAGMMAVATASMAHRVRPSISIPRCVPLVPRVRSIQPHRLTRVRACAARPSELLIQLVQGAEDAVFVTEKLSVAGQRSSFDRGAGAWPRKEVKSSAARAAQGCGSAAQAGRRPAVVAWHARALSAARGVRRRPPACPRG